MNNEKIVWYTKTVSVSELRIWDKNPRKISDESFEKLKERIVERGFHDVIKVDTDLIILSGNQRKKALLELGMKEVLVLYPNRPLTEEERSKVALESNHNDGIWDYELLQENFNVDLLVDIGFDQEELESVWSEDVEMGDDNFNEQEELKKIKEPKTKTGDLIILGKNRLICGDSNDEKVLERLCGDEKASIILSDPIYNLKINYNKGLGGERNFGGNVEDNRTEEDYISFLRKNISTALSFANPDCHVFYFNTEEQIWMLQTLYRELGIDNKRVCLWIKNAHNPTPQVAFAKVYEPAIYGTRNKPYLSSKETKSNEILNLDISNGNQGLDDINIWTAKRVSGQKMEHATQKPCDLYHKPIRRCSKFGDIILDSFGGSGTTLIAAEQMNRRAFLVEKEPVFCDLIIKRFEDYTGIKAKVISSNEEGKNRG